MPGKHYDLDTNTNLGGQNPSDIHIASQKAVKEYVDNKGIDDLKDVSITSVANGQGLVYDSTSKKWVNGNVAGDTTWGNITGTLSNQTDLNTALSGKSNTNHKHTASDITSGLSTVATSGDYEDLTNKPTIPSIEGLVDTTTNQSIGGTKTFTSTITGDISGNAGTATTLKTARNINGTSFNGSSAITTAKWGTARNITIQDNDGTHSATTESVDGSAAITLSLPATIKATIDGSASSASKDGSGNVITSTYATKSELPTVSDTYTATSSDAMSGKAVASAISGKANSADLKTVATSGSYNDLSNKPSIPSVDAVLSDTSTNAIQNKVVTEALNTKANSDDLSTVATSGSYNDLDNKPTIPSTTTSVTSGSTDALTSGGAYTNLVRRKSTTAATGSTTQPVYIDANGQVQTTNSIPTVTDTYSATSTNAMSGKAVASAISGKANSADLKTVATSGSYDDLSNKPSIPTVTDTYSATGTDAISGKGVASAITGIGLKSVATSGSYTDLSNKPTIPTVTDTYSADSSNAMSGKAVASAVSTALSSVLKYKGTKANYSDLPTTGNETGDVWNITNKDDTHSIKAGDNVAWNGTAWDVLSGTVDLSAYAKSADLKTVATSGSYNDLTDKPTIPSSITVDATLSTTSTNAIQNKAVATALNGKSDTTHKHTASDITSGLATIATSGSYNDLSDKPTIPSAITVDSALSSTSTNPVQNKVINTALNGKQATISDLATIRSNAESGAGAATTIAGYGDIVTHNASEFLTEHQTVDSALSATSENPVQNKVINTALGGKSNTGHKHAASDITSGLATVATSGSYNDLTNKPTIPAAITVDDSLSATSTNPVQNKVINTALGGKANSSHTHAASDITSGLATVATSGSYNDLSNKPTIPSAVTETTVSGWGFTKNAGTVTSVNNTAPVNGNVTISIPSAVTETTVSGWGFTKNAGTVTSVNSTAPDANGNVAITIPAAVTETTVSGWGFTKNAGTVTKVKINNVEKTPSSGIVDLGTVITSHQDISGKQDKLAAAGSATQPIYVSAAGVISTCNSIPSVTNTYSATGTTAVTGTAVKSALDGLSIPTTTSSVTSGSTAALTSGGAYTNLVRRASTTAATGGANQGVYINASGQVVACNATTSTYSSTGTTAVNGTAVASAISGKANTSHNQASSTINAMTGYTKATASAAIAATDSLNTAIGKLEYKVDSGSSSGKITVGQLAG